MNSRPRPLRTETGRKSRASGRSGEWLAAVYLMIRGYQILGFRLKTPQAEIDILARKGRNLVVVEVKKRQSIELAMASLHADQQSRLLSAGSGLVRSRPSLARLQPRLDLIALSPKQFPRHVRGLLTPSGN